MYNSNYTMIIVITYSNLIKIITEARLALGDDVVPEPTCELQA